MAGMIFGVRDQGLGFRVSNPNPWPLVSLHPLAGPDSKNLVKVSRFST